MRITVGAVVLSAIGCGDPAVRELGLTVDGSQSVAKVNDRYIAVAVDTAQVVGGEFWNPSGDAGSAMVRIPPYDFHRPRLRNLARALAPAYLRIGGTDADRTYYDLSDSPVATPPAPYRWVLTRAEWDSAGEFARWLDAPIVFTLDAGAGPRDQMGAWQPDNAAPLIDYSVANEIPVAVWELGNELDLYPLLLGITVQPSTYAVDARAARALLAAHAPGALLGGPSSAYWPAVGELRPFYPDVIAADSGALDVITWHYYPQQSRRCGLVTQAAESGLLLDGSKLDDVATWATSIEATRDQHAPTVPVWLGETGHAQCGGEPGLSDRFEASLWWLDELGTLARHGEPVIVRQTLSGGDYGLIDDATLDPNPDYWATLLWRRLMGPEVLGVSGAATTEPSLRVYAHCAAGRSGAIAVIAINLDPSQSIRVRIDGTSAGAETYVATAELASRTLSVNGQLAAADGDGVPADPQPSLSSGVPAVVIPPASYGFLIAPGADAQACR